MSLAKFKSSNGTVYGTLTIDTRHISPEDDATIPVVVRVAFDGKKTYLNIGKQFTMDEWMDLCLCEKLGRNKKDKLRRKELKSFDE